MKQEEFEYRLYYDVDGRVFMASMQDHPDGQYLVATLEEFNNFQNYRVVNNRLELIKKKNRNLFPLEKRENGQYKVVKNNAGLLIEENEEHSNIEYYDHKLS